MLALVRRPFVLGPVFVCLAFASQQSSAGDQSPRTEAKLSWDSPKMRDIEKEYESLWGTSPTKIAGNDSKTKYVEQERLVNSLFRKRLSERDLVQLAASCDALPVHAKERSLFANDLLAFMVRAFVEWGDRDRLITFLSTRCPGHMPWNATVEFHLAFRGRRMRDPILILGEAYSKCTVTEVRHDIAAAVRRAFAGLGIQGKDEADLVANAMKWYAREKDHVAVNEFFWARASPDVVEAYESQPEFYETFSELHPREHLFEEKASSAERSHHDQEAEPPQRRYVDSAERTAAPESGDGRSSQNDSKMLEGTWKVIERTYDGHTSSRRGDEEIRCLIGKEAFTWIPPRGRVELRMSFPENQPGAIDLITTGGRLWEGLETTPLIKELLVETTPSIYELKGDTLRICQAEPGAYRRPTSFEAGEGSGQTLFTLKRVSTAGRKAALGISAALVVVALFFWPTRGLYWRWKRKPTTRSQLLALAEAHGTQGHALG